MEKTVKLLGTISISLGTVAAFLCLLPNKGLLYALFMGFLGLITSTIYIFLNTRYEINKRAITPGFIGLIVSSTPVLLILFFILKQKIGF